MRTTFLSSCLAVISIAASCASSCTPPEEHRVREHHAADAAMEHASAPARVREATSAGQFYPGRAEEIRSAVDALFAGVTAPPRPLSAPVRMVLVPHAGWEFSGVVGATALSTLARGPKRVVIVAANHNGDARFTGVSVERSTLWRLPGLEVPVDPRTAGLLGRPGFVDVPEAHGMHMIESELPLLSHALGRGFSIVPLIVGRLGRSGAHALARELSKLDTPDTVFVISVDLSHYYPYERAQQLDHACLQAIERMDADAIAECDTDGTQVLLTMAELAAIEGWTPRLLRAQNSGDVGAERDRVVGYGAMAFEDALDLTGAEEQALLELARTSLEARVRGGGAPPATATLERRFPRLAAPGMAFVTLREHGALRGCIGSLEKTQPLAADVVENAAHAAVDDHRFRPVEPGELSAIDVSISVLSEPRPLDTQHVAPDELARRFGREHPGVLLTFEGRHSTFLPSVWEEISDPVEFLGALCRKQGSAEECWRQPTARYETYGAEHFGEAPARSP
jgi:AmmeMemoRadiSam system protein B/AmmeMemoRadiSam system protein A